MDILNKLEKHYKSCLKARVVSFDVFGTLIIRDIGDPDDVFKLVEKKTGEHIRDEKDCDLNDLFECELLLDHPNHDMIVFLRRLKAEGKTVILTSDMYLNETLLRGVLEHVGIKFKEDYDQLLVSCEHGCTKKDGGLYKKIKDKYKVEYSEIVHIGDGFRSDFLKPTTLGIKAIWINTRQLYGDHLFSKKELNNLNRFIDNHAKDECYEYYVGYKCFGPLLYGFTKWLNERLPHDGTKVYFLAREGDMFLKAFEKAGLRQDWMHYMMVSRRSINNALLWQYSDAPSMVRSIRIDRKISFKKVLALLGITEDPGGRLSEIMFGSSEEIINDVGALSFIKARIDKIISNSKQEYAAMKQYFDSIDFNDGKDCVIVDIGWIGTIQRCLKEYLKTIQSSTNIRGFYLGVHTNNYREDAKTGFLFDGDSVKKQGDIFTFVGLLESVLSEQNGSVKQFRLTESGFDVVRCNYEYNEKDIAKIYQIQKGMLTFVEDIANSAVKEVLNFNPWLSSYNLLSFGNNPTEDDLAFYRSLMFSDDSYNLSSSSCLKRFSVNDFKNDFMNSVWKTAFLKCMFGRWFPAKAFYDLLYALRKNK